MQEADWALQGSRLDALPYEPVATGPVICASDVVLITPKRNYTEKNVDLLEVVYSMDLKAYGTLFFCLHLVVCIIAFRLIHARFLKRRKRKKHFKLKPFLKHYFRIAFRVFQTILDQEDLEPALWPIRIAWTSFVLVYFVLMFGYLLNLMSVDMVAQTPPPELHSLKELLSPEFSTYQPFVLKILYTYGLAKDAKPESDLGQLFKKILKFNDSIIESDMQSVQEMQGLLMIIEAGQGGRDMTLCILKELWTVGLKPAACTIREKIVLRSYMSRETFATGLLVNIFNKRLDKDVLKYSVFLWRSLSEFSLTKMMGLGANALAESFGLVYDLKAQMCEFPSSLKDITLNGAMPLISFKGTLKAIIVGLTCSLLRLIVECGFFKQRVTSSELVSQSWIDSVHRIII